MKVFILSALSFLAFGYPIQNQGALNTQVKESLKKADVYFSSIGTDIKARDVVMLLFILREHFQYPLSLPALEAFKANDRQLGISYLMVHGEYFEGRNKPHISDSMAVDYLKKNVNSIDGLTAWSMFCDRYPLPDTIINVLNENIGKGGYAMTHTALQLANMLHLGCVKETPETGNLKKRLIAELEFGATNELTDVTDDLRYESLAMLYYIGADSLVTDKYIEWVVNKQLPDGGWSAYPDEDSSSVHASVLALWTLLEYNSRHK